MKETMKTQVEFTKGNKKLPATTYILNCGSASDCPSDKLGLCEVSKECYAKKAEIQYPDVLPFRKRQRNVFTRISGENIASELLKSSKRSRSNKMVHFRFSEAGDFRNQKDVEKMATICRILSENGVKCYGYTARTDLDLTGLLNWSSVNVSNDLNQWKDKGANRFLAVKEYSKKNLRCVGSCKVCDICSRFKGKTVEVEIH
jgi:hypothetical protein